MLSRSRSIPLQYLVGALNLARQVSPFAHQEWQRQLAACAHPSLVSLLHRFASS
jgi:hypothetical protein